MPVFTPWEQRNSYYKGLELGKDVKTLTSTLNKQTKAMIAGQLASTSAIVASQERIREGIDTVAIGIDRVCDGIYGLQAAFEWGIGEIVWQIEQNRQVLKSILEVLSAPLDTQARELRKRAEEAYQNGWIEDALTDFLESEVKNRYDFSVHVSLGNIYLFHQEDQAKALEYFEKAIKYAKPKSAYHTSYALLHKAIIKHSAGLVKEAEECTDHAVGLSPNFAEAFYQNAQYNAQLKNALKAIKNLEKAIKFDKYYAVKADNDRMFDPIRNEVNRLIERLRDEINRLCVTVCDDSETFINNINQILNKAKENELSEFHNKDLTAKASLVEIRKLTDRNSYLDSLGARVKLPQTFAKVKGYKEEAKGHLNRIVYGIESEIAGISGRKEEKNRSRKETIETMFPLIGGIISAFPGFKSCTSYSALDPPFPLVSGELSLGGFFQVTVGNLLRTIINIIWPLIVFLAIILLGAGIGMLVGKIIFSSINSGDNTPIKVKELKHQKKIFEAYLDKVKSIPLPDLAKRKGNPYR